MAGKKGYEATRRLRHRDAAKRGGKAADPFPAGGPATLAGEALNHLEWLEVRNYTPDSIEGRRDALKFFLNWAHGREVRDPRQVTKAVLESYRRHLWRWKKSNGKPLGVSTQRSRLGTLKSFFKWLSREDIIEANPASELDLPRQEKRLPAESLTRREIEAVLAVPNTADPLGLRDRAMLETLYSTGIRRSELARLNAEDLNTERGTLQIRQGKGKKDRVVPVGSRAIKWLSRYLDRSRPKLAIDDRERSLFLTSYGEAFHPDVLSRMATKFIRKGGVDRGGSCHLFRHTCATHMLEGGADIRFIQRLLGHEKLETTAIYTEVSIQQLQAVHAKTHPAETGDAAPDPGIETTSP